MAIVKLLNLLVLEFIAGEVYFSHGHIMYGIMIFSSTIKYYMTITQHVHIYSLHTSYFNFRDIVFWNYYESSPYNADV